MTTMTKPAQRITIPLEADKTIVLLDVDGVVSHWGRQRAWQYGLTRHNVDHPWGPLYIADGVAEVVRDLVDKHDVRWCTAWRNHANRCVGPVLGIRDLEVIDERTGRARGADWKLDEVIRLALACDNPIVWIEDFEQSWLQPGAVKAHLEGRVHLVDTSEVGYLKRGMLEHLYEEGVL